MPHTVVPVFAALAATILTTPVLAQSAALVKDLNPDAADGASALGVTLGEQHLFAGNGGPNSTGGGGLELWSTDGTPDGTYLVKNVNPATGTGSNPVNFTLFRGRVFFTATTETHGAELWATDGTTEGTVLIKDINPGPPPASSNPGNFRVAGNFLYFAANGGAATGTELWRTDGTAAGTMLVKDVNPGASGSTPSLLTAVGDRLFFRATTIAEGLEPWWSDGTAAGTAIVADLNPGPSGSNPTNLAALDATRLLFAANAGSEVGGGGAAIGTELYGTTAGTPGATLIKDINIGPNGSNPSSLTPYRGRVYFAATDGVGPGGRGLELWSTDGTTDGTALVTDLNPGPANATPVQLTVIADRLFFSAADPDFGPEPRVLDGDTGSIALLADVRPGPVGSSLTSFGDGNPWIVFTATDGTSGAEPYRSNAAPGGDGDTSRIADINPGPNPSNPSNWRIVANRLIFLASDGVRGVELWTVAVPDGFGSCCGLDRSCTLTTLAGCEAAPGGGGGFTLNRACGPDPCADDPAAACCYRDGTCLLTTRRQCFGVSFVLDTACEAAACPPAPVGACCAGAACGVLPWNQCSTVVYQGDGTTCSPDAANPTTCCRANLDELGGVDLGDLFAFLNLWFAQDARADFDASGGPPTIPDIFAYLSAWFAGC